MTTAAEHARYRAELKAAWAEVRRESAEWRGRFAAAVAASDSMAASLVVLALHAEEGGCCLGCDVGGYEAEQPGWPCRTVRLLAEFHGCPAPELVYEAKR